MLKLENFQVFVNVSEIFKDITAVLDISYMFPSPPRERTTH
jgi:hypothetical protein